MKQVKIYLHSENTREVKILDVNEGGSCEDIVSVYRKANPKNGENANLFFEDEEDNENGKKEKKDRCEKLKGKEHIHCHRCNKIGVSVLYNGRTKAFEVPPSTTTSKLLKIVIKGFNISENDASTLLLRLSDQTVLEVIDHIGSFVAYPNCNVSLFLTPNKQVQG